jgi:enoyl-CoA hydratase/carnithine racemase
MPTPIEDLRFEGLRVALDDRVAVVTVDRPPVNAHNEQLFKDVARLMDRLGDERRVRAVVLTAAGRVFGAGVDLKDAASPEARLPGHRGGFSRSARECFHAIRECTKPVVAAINGAAVGSGFGFAASCDILVCSSTAYVALPEIDVGALGGAAHTQKLFGRSLTRRMLLTGYRVSAEELFRRGVVEAVVEPEALMETALGIAHQIAGKSPAAVRLAKECLNVCEEMVSLRDGYRFEQMATAKLAAHPHSAEAKAAFVEKRQPVFDDSAD